MNDKEKRIQEQRTIEAAKKNLSIKGICIAKNLGQPMVLHDIGGFSEKYEAMDVYNLDDEPNENEMPYYLESGGTFLEEPYSSEWQERNYNIDRTQPAMLGYYYNGLRSGFNLEIKQSIIEKVLIIRHAGKEVYKDFGGDLHIYVPDDTWENMINVLYNSALKVKKNTTKIKKEEMKKDTDKKIKDFWNKIKSKWGV